VTAIWVVAALLAFVLLTFVAGRWAVRRQYGHQAVPR
jgi:hypothetical protein